MVSSQPFLEATRTVRQELGCEWVHLARSQPYFLEGTGPHVAWGVPLLTSKMRMVSSSELVTRNSPVELKSSELMGASCSLKMRPTFISLTVSSSKVTPSEHPPLLSSNALIIPTVPSHPANELDSRDLFLFWLIFSSNHHSRNPANQLL